MKNLDHPSPAVVHIDPVVAGRMVMASADVAVILDRDGIVKDALLAAEARLPAEFGAWLGSKWVDTVAPDSRNKAQQLLADAAAGLPGRLREINHISGSGGPTVPIRYSAMKLDDSGQILAVGRDLRAVAALQQQLVEFQQSMEREYSRLRAADTRYRVLFQLTSEPILIADVSGRRISEANPAAITLLGVPPSRVTGRLVQALFADKGGEGLQEILSAAMGGAASTSVTLTLADGGAEVGVKASLFRQDGAAYFLLRLAPVSSRNDVALASAAMLEDMTERLPDAVVMTDGDGLIRRSNSAFLDMAGLGNAAAAIGQPLDQWLGRAGVDFGVLRATMRDGGVVRNFTTIMRSTYGLTESVDITAVGGLGEAADHLGILIRPAGRVSQQGGAPSALPRSAEELKQLVGRVPLKELVRETSDIIEKLCIEAALELTGDNRASAAEMLGVSRQGLYAKMHRFGIGDLSGES